MLLAGELVLQDIEQGDIEEGPGGQRIKKGLENLFKAGYRGGASGKTA